MPIYKYECPFCGRGNNFAKEPPEGIQTRCVHCDKTFIILPKQAALNPNYRQSSESIEPKRAGSITFYHLLDELSQLHEKKSHDYASTDNPVGNYHFAGEFACMFAHSPQDAGFIGRIGEKLYRLANLERDGKTPKNESVEDTERDICVIICLWMADRRDRRNKPNPLQTELLDLIKLMPDFQTQEIVDFIAQLRAARARRDETAAQGREVVEPQQRHKSPS